MVNRGDKNEISATSIGDHEEKAYLLGRCFAETTPKTSSGPYVLGHTLGYGSTVVKLRMAREYMTAVKFQRGGR